ncbi:SCO6745 family protein [Actinoplanes awajinensis]|uniref:SalK n=1 Tax=Actinoplanes awajinensis subsp. mycoplanecinus TaxID=135947 RepID=A0A101JJE6_9ACTN|nr:hypothetical protein [Actinoplanes awajinensis]KUL27913.1 SalK [Actinoplanes awajinensis subsp. mycoplanecinus]
MTGATETHQPATIDPALVRQAWRSAEPVHGMIYFVPEAQERYAALGITGRDGYFASRAAALGAVGAEPVVAMFFNFNPRLVTAALPASWERATPAAVLAARREAAGAALTRGLGDAVHGPEVAEAAGLARRAAETAAAHPQGRPLFAAHAALPWPEQPHLVLWQALTVLREFRGDGHVAALLLAGLTGLEALVLHAASGEVPGPILRRTRGWSEEQWAGTVDDLRGRGLIEGDEPVLSAEGRAQRDGIEADTDRLATPAYAEIGAEGCARLAELARPLSRAVVAAGLLTLPPRT